MTSAPLSRTTDFYPNLDWLRLLFAIQVVAIHSGGFDYVFVNPVPAFLAVSGFVVMGSMERRPMGQFFINRILRVLPLLFVSFIAVGVMGGAEAMWANVLFWIWPFGTPPMNPVVWTLIYEEAFYILLAVLAAAGFYRGKYRALAVSLILLIAMLSPISKKLHLASTVLGISFFLGNAMYAHRESLKRINKWITIPIAIIPVAYVASLPYTWAAWSEQVLAHTVATAGLLLFGIAGPRLPRLTVDLSYSIYLIHCLVRTVLWAWIPLGVSMFWIMLLCTLPFSVAAWYLIEKPALKLKEQVPRWIARRREKRAGVRASIP